MLFHSLIFFFARITHHSIHPVHIRKRSWFPFVLVELTEMVCKVSICAFVLCSPCLCIPVPNSYFIVFPEAVISYCLNEYSIFMACEGMRKRLYSNSALTCHGWAAPITFSCFPKERRVVRSSPVSLVLAVSSLPPPLSPFLFSNNFRSPWLSSVSFSREEVWNLLNSLRCNEYWQSGSGEALQGVVLHGGKGFQCKMELLLECR